MSKTSRETTNSSAVHPGQLAFDFGVHGPAPDVEPTDPTITESSDGEPADSPETDEEGQNKPSPASRSGQTNRRMPLASSHSEPCQHHQLIGPTAPSLQQERGPPSNPSTSES